MNCLCVITIKLNTLTDVPYQMTVDDGAFVTYILSNISCGYVVNYKFTANVFSTELHDLEK